MVKNNVLHRLKREDYPNPEYKPEVGYDAGRIILDPDNHVILKYRIIPDALSSELSRRDMESMRRLDPRITRKDFRARIPRAILSRGRGKARLESLYTA